MRMTYLGGKILLSLANQWLSNQEVTKSAKGECVARKEHHGG